MTTSLHEGASGSKCGSLYSVVRGFLNGQGEITETRLQNLVFVSEVYTVTYCRRRLTAAEFRPYMYGAYSPDVSDALSTAQGVQEHRRLKRGNRTTVYSFDGEDPDLDDGRKDIVESISAHTSDVDTDALAQFSKDSWLFEHTPDDDLMRFAAFRDALDRDSSLERRTKRTLPNGPNVDCDELCELR